MDRRQILGVLTGKPGRHPYPEHMLQARQEAAEGMVLLKNRNRILPLKSKKVALFGAGATDTVSCGTGSGYVFAPYTVNVKQGLENAGISLTSQRFLRRFEKADVKANKEDKSISKLDRLWSGVSVLIDDLEITKEELAEARAADTAIYVVRRKAGEDNDRRAEKGDYYLSDIEEKNIRKITREFEHTIIILNTCVMDANFIEDIPGVDAAVLMGLAGCEGGNALADVLTGKVNPSGHLTDTWAKRYEDNPASATFGANDGETLQEDYSEGIYVGYRYFDSFGITPLYPFGYGLSYTDFLIECVDARADWKEVVLNVRVTNTGGIAGRCVPQIYVSAPEGRLDKPYQELKAYAKTKMIEPGKDELLTISFPTETLASYEEDQAAFLMEKGTYLIRLGEESRRTKVAAVLMLDADTKVRQVRNELRPDHPLQEFVAPKRDELCRKPGNEWMTAVEGSERELRLAAAECGMADGACPTTEADELTKRQMQDVQPAYEATLIDVKEGRVSIEEFAASLDVEVLLRLVAGNANETRYETKNRMKKR